MMEVPMSKRWNLWTWVAVFGLVFSLSLAQADAQGPRGPFKDVQELPEGPVGERITGLLEAFNSNDPARIQVFLEKAFTPEFLGFAPMDQHLSIFRSMFEQTRGLDFYGFRRDQEPALPGEIVVIVRNRLIDGWEAFVLNVEQDPPHRIAGVQFTPARPPSDLPPGEKLDDAAIVTELESFLERLAAADAFSGTVLLAKHGNVLYRSAHGLASKRFDVFNRINTKFNLGSANKMFTGVAILQLVQAGELSLDDPLSRFLSEEWLPVEMTEKIKIKHLLTHTSGLGSYFNETYMKSSKNLFRELEDYRPLIADSELAFEPGTDWKYSNTGMFLLGVVIEKVSGENFFDYIRMHIYEPAGMINSDCYDMDTPVPNLAIGYTKGEEGEWRNNLYLHVIRGGPAGGGFSTVEDLFRFDQALRSHKLLDREHTEMVWSPKPELNSPSYGFGFGIDGTPDDRIVGHGGGFPGINAQLDIYLDSGYTVAVLSNYDNAANTVASKIGELIRRSH
jgi:CubicO group peptidase (beta-lactamase class C family)